MIDADALRAVSPYFAVELSADGPEWTPLAALIDDRDVLRERVAAAQALLAQRAGRAPADIDERATASIHFLGVVARLIAPPLGAAVLTGTVPALAPSGVHWKRVDGGPMPLAVTSGETHAGKDVDALAGLLHRHVIATVVEPLATAVGREFRLSPRVLWGNVASATAGAAGMLGTGRAAAVTRQLLAQAPLAGSGHYVDGRFVRANCCLFYRIPGGGTCADCVLRPARAARPS